MQAAKIQIVGDGLKLAQSESHPSGTMFSGDFDADKCTLFLASAMGHPRGVSFAGGDPSAPNVSGMRVLILETGDVYWATDSMSLPRGLTEKESELVQAALETQFPGKTIQRVDKLEDISG
jgi:hypothetical protein